MSNFADNPEYNVKKYYWYRVRSLNYYKNVETEKEYLDDVKTWEASMFWQPKYMTSPDFFKYLDDLHSF